MNEEKNNNLEENNNTENLGYSFDFANQVETEPLNVTPIEQPAVNIENPATQVVEQPVVEPVQTVETPAEPQMIDVSVPVLDETLEPVQAPVEPTPEVINNVVEPVKEVETPATQVVEQPTVEPVQTVETPVAEPQMVDVSVPVMDTTIPNNNQEPVQNIEPTQEPVNQSQEVQTTDLKDGKSTVRFVIILAVIVIAFIIALPFILNFLG